MFKAKYASPLCPGEKITEDQLKTDHGIMAFGRAVEQLSRRKFLGGLSGASALAVTAGFIEMPRLGAQTTATPAITDVLNFALNLEYLEANLYYFASTGNVIPTSYSGTPASGSTFPTTALYTAVQANSQVAALAAALAQDELNHINDLRTAITSLGGTPVNQPALNYAAKGAVTTVPQFLATARQFTALGNSAYAGAAQFLVSNTSVLTTAAQILGAEGQHLGAVNFQCILNNVTSAFSSSPSAYDDALDTPPSTGQFFTVFLSGASNTNSTSQAPGLAPARTVSQDLGVVYGVSSNTTVTPPAGVTSGGFFPSGVNGSNPALKST